jgi:hypothetical protein
MKSSAILGLLTVFAALHAHASVEVTSFIVNEGGSLATATVKLSSSPGNGWLLDYETRDGTAEDENGDNDYSSRSGTLSFAPGDTEEAVSIPIIEDAKIEGDEQFSLDVFNLRPIPITLTQSSASQAPAKKQALPPTSGSISIEDNDTELFVNIEFIGGSETQAEVTLTCNSGDVDGTGTSTNSKAADATNNNSARFEVINFGPATLQCQAAQTNEPPSGYTDTTGASCSLGFNESSDRCTVQNTLVESQLVPVPTLSQYGLILLLLLTLGVGLTAGRARFPNGRGFR